MKEEWLFRGALVPIDAATTAALVAEIKRLIDVVGGMALAQPEQEPVAELAGVAYVDDLDLWHFYPLRETDNFPDGTKFYTTPPKRPWVGLTDEQRSQLVTLHHGWNEYGQAIEAALRSKNT